MPMPMPLTRPLTSIAPLFTRMDTSTQSLLFKAWLFIGVLVNWVLLFITAHGTLQLEPKQVGFQGFFFIPICILLHCTILWLWNCSASQRFFGTRTRIFFSCASVNIWAGACMLVYANTESVMWTIAWWFMLVPMILLLCNKIIVSIMMNSGRVYNRSA